MKPDEGREGTGRDDTTGLSVESPSRATAVRHLVLGFGLLVTILLAAALCGLPR